ncbi:calcium-binding protein [Geminicoccus flavidas]|uniref:calcium-binding protein n=1 Tax=Geminicoccus flavidas TaxID=2506407 RepID=UPI0038B400C7
MPWPGNEDFVSGAMLLFGGTGNERASGGDGADNMRGELGDDILQGGDGNDRLYGDQGSGRLIGGSGDDVIYAGKHAGGEQSVLSGDVGSDTFRYEFNHAYDWTSDDRCFLLHQVSDVIGDFTYREDKLFIEALANNAVDDPSGMYTFDFADLDTNGNGILTDADEAISINWQSFMGKTRHSLTIDIGKFAALQEAAPGGFSGTITLFGVTSLTADDFVSAS